MKRFVIFLLLGFLIGGALLGLAIIKRPTWKVLATMPERILAATPHDGTLLVATGISGLFRVDPATGEGERVFAAPNIEIKDVHVSHDLAYLLAYTAGSRRYDMYVVEPATGQLIRSFTLGSSVSDLPGFLPSGRLVIVGGAEVRVINANTQKFYGRVVINNGLVDGAFLDGDRLYVARRFEGGLGVIDAKNFTLEEMIQTDQWLTDVDVAGGRAYVSTVKSGRGYIDLETRAFTPYDHHDVFVMPGGRAYALEREILRTLGGDDAPAVRISLPGSLEALLDGGAFLVSVADTHAIIACANQIVRLDWPR